MVRGFAAAAVFAGTFLGAAGTARAAVSVIGDTAARQCYLAADAQNATEAAVSVCAQALANTGLPRRDRVASFVNRGIVHMHRQDVAAALADYDAAISLDPDIGDAHTNRGIALYRSEMDDRAALASLTRGIELDTNRAEVAYLIRGLVNERLGNVRAAYADYRRAAALAPE
ncbi:MAG: hypothetical protein AAF205_03560 [Pseudomonadota bacterium]